MRTTKHILILKEFKVLLRESLVSKICIYALFAVYCLLITDCCSLLYAAFKEPGWGVRPVGMGGAFTAIADDNNANIYNPAGLVKAEGLEAGFMYSELFRGLERVDLKQNFLSSVIPINSGLSMGFMWANFMSLNQYREDIFSIAVSKRINEITALGISAKYMYHGYTLDKYVMDDPVFVNGTSKGAVSFDAGALFDFAESKYDTFTFGAALKNLNQPDVGLNSPDKVPLEGRIGIKYEHCAEKYVFTPALDISFRLQDWGDDTSKFNIFGGCEIWIINGLLGLRAGANVNEFAAGFSICPDLKIMGIQIDYAFAMPVQVAETQGSHRLALTLKFIK